MVQCHSSRLVISLSNTLTLAGFEPKSSISEEWDVAYLQRVFARGAVGLRIDHTL